jgi:hypothetical protein
MVRASHCGGARYLSWTKGIDSLIAAMAPKPKPDFLIL